MLYTTMYLFRNLRCRIHNQLKVAKRHLKKLSFKLNFIDGYDMVPKKNMRKNKDNTRFL